MPRVVLDGNLDHLVTPQHSDARGPVVRGASIEVMKMHWRAGDSARAAPAPGRAGDLCDQRPHAHDMRG